MTSRARRANPLRWPLLISASCKCKCKSNDSSSEQGEKGADLQGGNALDWSKDGFQPFLRNAFPRGFTLPSVQPSWKSTRDRRKTGIILKRPLMHFQDWWKETMLWPTLAQAEKAALTSSSNPDLDCFSRRAWSTI